MQSGLGTTSVRKQDLADQKNIATGFVKTQFAHQCAGGETGINLNSLTLPSQMSANGFSNPTGAQLAAANLTTYRKNLKLVSSLRGQLIDYLSYTVSATGTQITFQGFTAQPGEVFVGTLDYSAVSGVQVVSATGQPASGQLSPGATTFSFGYSVPTNQYSTTNVGGVLVYLDGVLQTRNTGNSSTTQDGNYYELDNGSGNFSQIVFNVADPSQTRNVMVIPNGLLVPQPDGSLLTTVQTLAGQINQLAQYVATLAGQQLTTVLGGAASYTDLLAFGNTVNSLNTYAALLNKSNAWTAPQSLPGQTSGAAVASGNIGQVISASYSSTTVPNNSATNAYTISVPAGIFMIFLYSDVNPSATTTGGGGYYIQASGTGVTQLALPLCTVPSGSTTSQGFPTTSIYLINSAGTTVTVTASSYNTGASAVFNGQTSTLLRIA